MTTKQQTIKKCPRCGEKAMIAANKCRECGLVFARMARASNYEGKLSLRNKEKNKVMFTSMLPYDLPKMKLLLMCVFGGIFGLHSFFVGRWKRGTYSLVCFLITMSIIVFQLDIIWPAYDYFMSFFFVFGGTMGILWFYDIILISLGKFKVPVSLKPEVGREA